MVISTGITLPRMDSVWALYALQNSMMFTPCGPSAVPTGGAGVAAPAWSCTLTSAAIFFLGGMLLLFLSRGHDEEYVVRLCHLLLVARGQPDNCAASYRESEILIVRISRRVARSLAALGITPTLLNLFGDRSRSKLRLRPQTFWIWLNDSSTGVSRPKISTRALTRWDSALISVIVAWSVANGPSTTMTESETSKSATSTGFFAAAAPPADGVPA